MTGIKPKGENPLSGAFLWPSLHKKGHFMHHLDWNGFSYKAVSVAAAVSVSTLSGAILVFVTFLIFSHHLRSGQRLCLTFEAPSGRPLEEQQPAHLTFMSAFKEQPPPTPNTHTHTHTPTLSPAYWELAPLDPVSGADTLDLLLSSAPQRAGWLLQPVSMYILAD